MMRRIKRKTICFIDKYENTKYTLDCRFRGSRPTDAEIAQLVEHFTRNEGVEGSSHFFSFDIKALEIQCF